MIALSLVGVIFVEKNGDVISYLDKDTKTIEGKELLEKEFGIIGDLTVAVSYAPESLIANIARDFSRHSVVKRLVWKGSFDDLERIKDDPFISETHVNMTLQQAREKYVHVDEDGNTTYFISIYFNTAGSDKATIDEIDKLEERLQKDFKTLYDKNSPLLQKKLDKVDDHFFIGGTSQNARALVKSSLGDMPKFIIIAIVICLIILILTTKSYLEPLIFLATLGVSILLNMGTNIIAGNPIGTISTITSSCAIILQLALAMDYSIFLMHTYYEEKKFCIDPKEALRKALPKTIIAVTSSALTTVGGFVALFFMEFGMGYDLGFVLAKGVILSLVTVIMLQPIFILMFSKLIDKTHHDWKIEVRMRSVAKVATKPWFAIIITIVCLGLAVPCAYFQTKVPLNYITMNKVNPNPTATETLAGNSINQIIVLVPYNKNDLDKYYKFVDDIKSLDNQSKEEFLKYPDGTYVTDAKDEKVRPSEISGTTEVFGLFTLVSKEFFLEIDKSTTRSLIYRQLHASFISNIFTTDATGKTIINDDPNAQHLTLFTVNLTGSPEDLTSYKSIEILRKLGDTTFGTAENKEVTQLTGLAVGANDLKEVTPKDFMLVNVVSVLLIFLVLLFTFRKFFLSLILLFVIETGIFINLTLVLLLAPLGIFDSQINFISYIIVSAIELGATVDYAIMVTSKYLEEKKNGATGLAAIKNGMYRAAPAVLTSGSILIIICFAIRLVTSNMIVGQITELLARGAIMSVVLVFTLLPGILSLMESRKRKRSIKKKGIDPDEGKNPACLYDLPYGKKAKQLALATANNAPIENQSDISNDIMNDSTTSENCSLQSDIVEDNNMQETTLNTQNIEVEEYTAVNTNVCPTTDIIDDNQAPITEAKVEKTISKKTKSGNKSTKK